MSKKVIFCNCGAKLIGSEQLKGISDYLELKNSPVTEISDLCGCAVDKQDEIRRVFNNTDEFLIIACYPRSISLLLGKCGIDIKSMNLNYINFRELNNIQIFKEIDTFLESEDRIRNSNYLTYNKEWPSWFPMIDYSRCNSCGQCSDFCLFGVYEKIDNKVVVVNPKGCKYKCPACARICPQIAIIFPKYEHSGAIAGSDTFDELAEQKRQNSDIDTILGTNIYKALEIRKAKRQSIIRSTAMQQAILEREKALAEKNPNQ